MLYLFSRQVGVQQWTSMDTNSNKGSAILTVLMPDTTYQVKVQTQCLSKQHRTNEILTLRTPEGCKSTLAAQSLKWLTEQLWFTWKGYVCLLLLHCVKRLFVWQCRTRRSICSWAVTTLRTGRYCVPGTLLIKPMDSSESILWGRSLQFFIAFINTYSHLTGCVCCAGGVQWKGQCRVVFPAQHQH